MALVTMEPLSCQGRVRMRVGKATGMEEAVLVAVETANGRRTLATEDIRRPTAFDR